MYEEIGLLKMDLRWLMDEQYLRHPEFGSPRMTDWLREQGCLVNQAWNTGMTYTPMQQGFMYLTAVIDGHGRYVIS